VADPIVEPASIQRLAEAGETVAQDFIVNRPPNGTLVASISGDSSIIRLRELVAYKSERRQFTEEQIMELPPMPPSIRQNARRNGYLEYSEFGRVGPGSPLTVWSGLLVKGDIDFIAPATAPPDAVDATLVLEGTNWQQSVKVPLLLVIGKIQVEFASSPVDAHQGQEVRVPVRVTLPAGNPPAEITLELAKPNWQMPLQVVSVPSGGSASATLKLRAAREAPLGTFSTELEVKGFERGRVKQIPFQITVKPFSQKIAASEHMEAKAAVLSEGPPGPRMPLGDTEDAGNGGFVQRYSTGNLYWHPQTGAGARWVSGAILQKYLALGGPSSLGYPITDERPTPDGRGRFNHFQAVQLPDKPESSIYWTPQTDAHAVYGAIRSKWKELGFERSSLGYPLAEEVDFPEGGRVVPFEGGAIYWWADTGAIELGDVVVNYTGLHCFGETDFDQPIGLGQGADEPYVVVGAYAPSFQPAIDAGFKHPGHRSQIYEDVDAGESRPDLVEIYRGMPGGLGLAVFVIEHDAGNPDAYKGLVQTAVTKAATSIIPYLAVIPVVGPVLAVVGTVAAEVFGPALGAEINSLFDLDDDIIGGKQVLILSAKEMVLLAARTPKSNFNNIGFKRETEIFSGEGASYKVYFSVDRA
jgi:LGFP repeat